MSARASDRPRTLPFELLCLTWLVVAVYGFSLSGDFVWDDRPLIVDNERIRSLSNVGELLTSSFWETGDRHDRFRTFFRPLVSVSYAVDHAVWGLRPWGFRITGLLLHWVCTLLVYAVARSERLSARLPLAAAALFAVHPVHVESVAWISGRTDTLCTALVLGAFLLHRRASRSARPVPWLALACVVFGCALLAKEMAATLPLLVGLDRWFERKRLSAALWRAAPFLLVLGLYVLMRQALIGGLTAPLFSLDAAAWVATALFVVARYLTLLLLPAALDAHYPYGPPMSLLSPVVLLSAAMLGVVGVAGHRLMRRSPRDAFWLAWVLVSLVPVLAFGRFGDVLMADRFLYLPSAGLALFAACGLGRLLEARSKFRARGTAAVALALVLGLAVAGFARTRIWMSDHALFSEMVTTSPGSALVRCNLGLALYGRGELDLAIEQFTRAIELEPSFSMAHNNLAVALEGRGEYRPALQSYLAALRLAPAQLEAGINAGHLFARLGQPERGLAMLREIVRQHPDYPPALYALATVLEDTGRSAEALPLLQTARQLDPDFAGVYYLVGKIRLDQRRPTLAADEMRRFLELWPHEDDPWARAARAVILETRAGVSAARTP